MKKVFLIDDEMLIRKGISESIDWNKEGFEYCGDAPDGEVALPLIEKHQPHIVITDIKMPFMDGLELSKILRQRMPWIKIIVLSGHDEFEYAREAMRLQVTDYCLKPITGSDLLSLLHKVAEKIDQEDKQNKHYSDLESIALQKVVLSKNKLLTSLCEGTMATSEAIKKASELGIDIIASYYYVILLESESFEWSSLDWIEKTYDCIAFKKNNKELVCIVKGSSRQQLEDEADQIRNRIQLESPAVLFGLGKVESRIQGIPISYEDAEEEKSYSRIVKKYIRQAYEEENESSKQLHHFNRKELIHFLKFGDIADIEKFSKTYSSYLEDTERQSPLIIYYFLMDFTITIKHYIKDREQSKDILENINKMELQSGWIREYNEVLLYLVEMLQLVFKSRDESSNKHYALIQKTKDYIIAHYDNQQLSLQNLAQQVNVSPAYLSNIFSLQTNQTITEFLTATRIERAKELLKTTNDKTYEIAYKVGYSDSHYFCHSFKKITGMTTKEFKNHGQIASSSM
ncbi:response regulator [Aquibacillus koreensis]|uniref:Response regulator n=1 Tax=Aquibacillus koreensis TaxID=279446 RepID=A0A9X3WMJ3_9BACI|nr:response regulator [Aquibacillus koreensis]MCT2537212.1 response regulator [Aquibacillus koreensis]MDC3421560.1 response regulator [Aquibacillus koreensis]